MLMIVGSIIMSIEDKRCQSLFRQRYKNYKIKLIDHSIEKSLINLLNVFPNRIFYCIFKGTLKIASTKGLVKVRERF